MFEGSPIEVFSGSPTQILSGSATEVFSVNQVLQTIEPEGHSCKIGNVRYGGTSKIQN